MKRKVLSWINIGCYLAIMFYLVFITASALASGYPWAISCYNCGLCRQSCPIGLDPYGFIAAAVANDQSALVQAVNVKLLPRRARMLDASMPVVTAEGRRVDLGAVPPARSEKEIYVLRMQARYAAAYCILCGNCDRICPIKLPVTTIIKDYRK